MKAWQIRCGAPDCADAHDIYLDKQDAELDLENVKKKCEQRMKHCNFYIVEVKIIGGDGNDDNPR